MGGQTIPGLVRREALVSFCTKSLGGRKEPFLLIFLFITKNKVSYTDI